MAKVTIGDESDNDDEVSGVDILSLTMVLVMNVIAKMMMMVIFMMI